MMRKSLRRLDKVLSAFEDWTLFAAVTSALVMLFVSVLSRFGSRWGFTSALTWPEELVREVIIYTTFIGCAAGVKNRALIRVDALPNIFKGLKKPLDYFSYATLAVFAVFVAWYGTKMAMMQYKFELKTVILQIPWVVLYSILPLMGVLMLCRLAHVLYEDITGLSVTQDTAPAVTIIDEDGTQDGGA